MGAFDSVKFMHFDVPKGCIWLSRDLLFFFRGKSDVLQDATRKG
jgi:hypothetical protein